MRINFFDKHIIRIFIKLLGIVTGILSVILIFFDVTVILEVFSVSTDKTFIVRCILLLIFLFLLGILYIMVWIYYKNQNHTNLTITNSNIEIKYGNIFEEEEEECKIVIGFNEYFDTIVDNKIISSTSLHGQLIEKKYKTSQQKEYLNERIEKSIDKFERENGELEKTVNRIEGKKRKMPLGKIIEIDNYFLVSLTRFDSYNRAYLEVKDYINCLFELWEEIDKLYNGKSVAIPLLGSGITRFPRNEGISNQELLEFMLMTYKISRKKISPPAKLKIILYKDNEKKDINFLNLKDFES